MPTILVKHAVEDFDTWKPYFDDHDSTRREYGSQGYRLFKLSEDSNDLVMVFDWDTMENAQTFLESSDLRSVMGEAGVIGEPEIYFLEEIESKLPEEPLA
ncbi:MULTISPECIES: cyclase [Haloferax]|uniref:Cyclase n=1 Tax=Haloferax marinum TaxID=2666143 RepID=A0A6A8GCW8_9EURY|nr:MULTISPECIES: cyclase [Haloferax]KAB1198700.1 cyclase [Haloferax sp. CBA1150]MRW97816.1 cyclase [Haloferax marinum]